MIIDLIMGNQLVQIGLAALIGFLGWQGNNFIQRRKGANKANEKVLEDSADEAARILRAGADGERVQHDPKDKRGYRD